MNSSFIKFVDKYKYVAIFIAITSSIIYGTILKKHEDTLLSSDSEVTIGVVYKTYYQISKGKHHVYYVYVVDDAEFKGIDLCRTAKIGECYEIIYYTKDPSIHRINFKKKLHR